MRAHRDRGLGQTGQRRTRYATWRSRFDRFGRVKQQLWRDYTAPADRDKFTYTYDRNSNRTSKDLSLIAGKDEKYTYDHLNRLTAYDRGTLDGGSIPTEDKVRNEAWTLFATGNWTEYKINTNPDEDSDYTDAADLDQDRTHNLVNEIWNATAADAITEGGGQTAWASPVYDTRGNPFDCVPVRRDSAQGKL